MPNKIAGFEVNPNARLLTDALAEPVGVGANAEVAVVTRTPVLTPWLKASPSELPSPSIETSEAIVVERS